MKKAKLTKKLFDIRNGEFYKAYITEGNYFTVALITVNGETTAYYSELIETLEEWNEGIYQLEPVGDDFKIIFDKQSLEKVIELLEQQDEVAIDLQGRRWAKCVLCGEIDYVDNFSVYGGIGQINKGKCRECANKLDEFKERLPKPTRPLTNSKEDQELLARFLESEQDWEE